MSTVANKKDAKDAKPGPRRARKNPYEGETFPREVYFPRHIRAILGQDLLTEQAISNWMDDGRLPSFRLPGTAGRAGDRYVKHADLVDFLMKNPRQWAEALHRINEGPRNKK